MKRLLKILAGLALVSVLLAAGAAVLIKVKFPPEKVKALAAEQVKKNLHRELRLGDVSIGLWRGVSLSKVELSENPNFAAGTFLSAERVSVEPFLLPLLKGKVVIKRVSLDKPSARVARSADGRFNFSDLASSTAAETPKGAAPSAAPSGPPPLAVNALIVRNGAFSFTDRAAGLSASVKGLSLDVTGFSFTAPFSAALSCGVEAASPGRPALAGKISFKGRVAPFGEGRADVDSFSVLMDGANIEAKGFVKNFSAPDADLALSLKSLKAGVLAPAGALPPGLKDLEVKGDLRLKGGLSAATVQGNLSLASAGLSGEAALDIAVKDPAGAPRVKGTVKIPALKLGAGLLPAGVSLGGALAVEAAVDGGLDDLEATLSVDGSGAALAYGDLFAKPAGTALRVNARAALKNKADLALSAARLELGPAAFEVRGEVKDAAGAGRLDLAVKAAPFDVAPFEKMVPMAAGYKLAGKAGLDLAVKGTASAPQARGTITLAGLGAVPMEGLAFSKLSGTAAFTQDSLDLPSLAGALNGEALSLKAQVRNFSRPDVSLEGSLAALDLGKLQAAMSTGTAAAKGASPAPPPAGPPPVAHAKGAFRLGRVTHPYYLGNNFTAAWDLTDLGPDLSRLNGTAQLAAEDGRLRNLPMASTINKFLKRDGSDLPYDKIGGHMTISKGVLATQDFAVDSHDADYLAKGTVNLASVVGDLRLIVKMAKGAVGGSAGEWFADDDGRATVEFALKGYLPTAVPVPDLTKAAARAAKSFINKGLEKYLGGGSSNAAGDEGGSTPQKRLQEEGQKLLKGLFKKKS